MTFVLVHSPFLGPSCWEAVGAALLSQGAASHRLDLRVALSAEAGLYDALGRLAARQIAGPAILVVHSGAGALAPTIVRHAGDVILGAIFVDALLPHPGRAWIDTAPSGLVRYLRAEACDGCVPAWPAWIPPGQLARLLPEPAMLEALTRTAPLVPLRFLEEPAPDSQDQSLPPCAYLQLSAAYDAEAAQARRLHWPMERFDGHHLSLMTEPVGVAAMIIRLRKNLTPLLSTD